MCSFPNLVQLNQISEASEDRLKFGTILTSFYTLVIILVITKGKGCGFAHKIPKRLINL